jgi:transcriptional regulator with GAF, ATPase, and Fis domain
LKPVSRKDSSQTHVTDRSLNAKDFDSKIKLIERALVETGGNVAKAVRILELSVSDVHRLIPQGIVKRT